MNSIEQLKKVSVIVSLIIITLVTLSAVYSINNAYTKERELASEHARNAFEKHVNFRHWIAMHGGVYVFPTEKTPPNPYLKNHPYRDFTTTDGHKLTLMNPAYALKELLDNFPGRYNETGHLTSLKLLNPLNQADKWEENALKQLETKKVKEVIQVYNYQGKEHLRYMKGLVTTQECMTCHATQGYKVGDMRGGLSITIPMDNYNAKSFKEVQYILLFHVGLMILLLSIVFSIYYRLKKAFLDEQQLFNELQLKDQILFKQSKIASLGEMLNNIAHHWRQPLSIISTSASGLKLQSEFNTITPEILDKSMDEIIHTTQYLSQTIEDFSNLVDEHSKQQRFNISDYLLNDINIFKANTKSQNIEFILDIEESISIKNYKYAFTKSILYIFNYLQTLFEESEYSPKQLYVSLKQDNGTIIITLKENTNSVSEEIIDKLFEPYITSVHNRKGTCLGLYLAFKLITENLNGELNITPTSFIYEEGEQQGLCFTIKLPLENKE